MSKQTVIVGDVHGCIDELNELLRTIEYNPNNTRLIFLGDILDRGIDSIGCVRKVRELNAECVQCNHGDKHIRYRRHEITKNLTGKKNPMRPMSIVDAAAHKALTNDDIDWMRRCPLTINIKDNWYALHAGLEPALPFDKQLPNWIIRCRYVNEKGRALSLNQDRSKPAGSKYWADVWNGPENIVFGHCVFEEPQVFKNKNNTCIGIDTGAVYGGYLTALVFETMEFIKIKSKQVYYNGDFSPFED